MDSKKIAIIGGGNMGLALVRGILKTKWATPDRIMIAEPLKEKLDQAKAAHGIRGSHSNVEAAQWADVILLSVKPQIMGHVLEEIKPAVKDSKLIISVAAGVTTAYIEKKVGGNVPVVRAMPNIAALVRESATVICAGKHATEKEMSIAKHIFESVGLVVDLDEEGLMDAVTGLSGTGPMYVFQILEGLSDAGVKVGLSRDMANQLAVQTLIGSSKLIQETKEHPAKLKDLVTSPGGTAISALHSLEKNGLKALLIDAVEVAAKRSGELGALRKD
ncbi:MAG: pyrroline-5-carboxylate reductase [Euryarchaeota archaeon RBG_16_62_10]|nr:MAG: pyrroline-5-carboxylate reductase [Euryarchaeota archaeon RBG_16_62_10]